MQEREHARLAEHEEWYWWHRGRERIVHELLRRSAPPGARILDVGCGTGATTASLRRLGRVAGLDVGAEATRRAHGRGLAVARSSLAALPVRSEGFDVVVALDVLEHVDDDLAAAREIRRALAPGGVLLATVPAYPSLWSDHDVALGHRRRYRRGQLEALLEAAGLRVERCSYAMASILPVAVLVRLLQRAARRGPPQSGYVRVPAWLNALLTRLVALEGFWLRCAGLPFGLSLVALARRPGAGGSGGARA
jgi:SAM-dependent methyltransferase